jgi:hypothetical protein
MAYLLALLVALLPALLDSNAFIMERNEDHTQDLITQAILAHQSRHQLMVE